MDHSIEDALAWSAARLAEAAQLPLDVVAGMVEEAAGQFDLRPSQTAWLSNVLARGTVGPERCTTCGLALMNPECNHTQTPIGRVG